MSPADSDQALRNILDNLGAIVYVADMHSHELLFINAYARERLLDGAAMRYLIGSRTTTGMRRSVAAWYLA